MPRTNLNIRISPTLKAKLATEAAKEGMDLSTYLRERLPALVKEETVGISFGEEGGRVVTYAREPKVTHIGERMKSVIADAVETKLYLKTLGINLSDEGPPAWLRPYLPNITGARRPQATISPEPKKDFKEWVMEMKALESLDRRETDPEIKVMLKELKDAQIKALQKPPSSAKSNIKQRLDELKEYAMTMRIFGSDKEAKRAEELLRNEISGIRKELHDAELGTIRRESEYRAKDLERQIMEIKNAPSQFDQITQISRLSHQDPAIKAYLHKKLGIEAKESLTPEKLGKYIENIKVPVGDIMKGLWTWWQQRKGAPAEMPPPPTVLGEEVPTEIVGPPPTPPEEARLPPEQTPPPPPEKSPKKPSKKRRGPKKEQSK